MASLSIVIPVWSGTDYLVQMELDLIRKARPMCDELVITEDGYPQGQLKDIADQYLMHPELGRIGHRQNLVLGIKAATCDYIAVLDSDIIIVRGSLRDLCIPGKIVCGNGIWGLPPAGREIFWGWCFVADRNVLLDPQHMVPTDDPSNQGIDHWCKQITASDVFQYVEDKFQYVHLRTQSYGEYSESVRIARECSQS